MTAPVVSMKIAIRPAVITSIGATMTLPPADTALLATSSTSSTLM